MRTAATVPTTVLTRAACLVAGADMVLEGPHGRFISVDDTGLRDAGGRRYVTDREGRFRRDVEPGDYDVCYSWGDPHAGPVRVDACQPDTLPQDADLVLSVGEAPFGVTVQT